MFGVDGFRGHLRPVKIKLVGSSKSAIRTRYSENEEDKGLS